MSTEKNSAGVIAQWMRWIARAISSLITAFWLLILLDIVACDAFVGFICLNWEMLLLFGLVTASMLSVVIAWRIESLGGFVMLLWGLAFSAIAIVTSSGSQLTLSILVSGVPFFIAGVLFLASWWLRFSRASNTTEKQVNDIASSSDK
jgi:hypothetical protein